MGFMDPILPPYDALAWRKLPFAERSREVCRAWALQGYGSPVAVYLVYAFKVGLYAAGWVFFVRFTPGLGELDRIGQWWLEPIAFQKATLWSMAFEVWGAGCGSGPLTGRYMPPAGGFLYFLRPGTTKLALFPKLPLLGGYRRTWLDVLLYAGCLTFLGRALVAPALSFEVLLPIAIIVPLMGVADKTLFLAARAEHYWAVAVCFLFASDWIAGTKAVHAALWFWAGFSKLNHHFPAVVCVMTSNSPAMRFEWIRKRMYKHFPDDLRPSRLAEWMAHGGTALELAVPVMLLAGDGGPLTWVGFALMLVLHLQIVSSVPMGVPIEWNFMVVYGAFFLFWAHADVSVLSYDAPLLSVFVAGSAVLVPVLGNLFPARVSFLPTMRYYAGNWACSVWFFKGESYRKLDAGLKKTSPWVIDQLLKLYDERTAQGLFGKVMAFRLMHLHGRALQLLVPKAIPRFEDYEWVDGEIVAGLALGWNFGDGHLHDERLLAAIQAQCNFQPGELRCVFLESQPLFRRTMAYRIADAKTGPLESGELEVRALRALQPWPEA